MWTDDLWDGFCQCVREWFEAPREQEFDEEKAQAWRLLLDPEDPKEAIEALKRLARTGRTWRPSASEVVAEIRQDVRVPTFEELVRLLFDPTGVFETEGDTFHLQCRGDREGVREARQRARERAAEMHPLVLSFLDVYGWNEVRNAELRNSWGRKEVRDAWDRHVRVTHSRESAAAAGGTSLDVMSPLAALTPREARPVLVPAPEVADVG